MRVTRAKGCYCHTCATAYHYLGIARHRAMHRDLGENCKITYTSGDTYVHRFADRKGGIKSDYNKDTTARQPKPYDL
ncbi:hypothetical protein ES705_17404 [subsurface metagenome]